jgi:hypothetical protein
LILDVPVLFGAWQLLHLFVFDFIDQCCPFVSIVGAAGRRSIGPGGVLTMDSRAARLFRKHALSLTSFASKLAPTTLDQLRKNISIHRLLLKVAHDFSAGSTSRMSAAAGPLAGTFRERGEQ